MRLHGQRIPNRPARILYRLGVLPAAVPPAARVRYAWAVWATASAWLIVAAAIGAGPPMPGFLCLGMLAAAVPWWWHHRIRSVPEPPGSPGWAAIWEERVAVSDAALPGSRLTDYAPMDFGWSAVIELPAGKSTTSTAVAATERIASAYNASLASVVVEPTSSGDASRARLMVLTANPLQDVHPWPGPHLFDAAEGVAPIGVYPDGDQALYRFWRPGSGAVHGLIAGTSDAGKSRTTEMLLGYERHSGGLIASWICDPQHGQSLPDWMDHVDFAARTAEEGVVLLRMAVAVMYARNDHLAHVEWTDDRGRRRTGKASFEPTPVMPLLSITIEEAHAVLAYDEAVRLAEAIGKMGRKCGVSLRLIVQVPLLAQLGNSTTLRDAVAGGNVIVLRTANRLSSPAVLPMPVDPAQLPRKFPDGSSTSGLGFVLGATDRQAPMRGYYDLDPFGWATAGETVSLDGISARAAERAAQQAGTLYRAPAPVGGDGAGVPTADVTTEEPVSALPPAARRTARAAILAYLQGRPQAHTGVIADELGIPLPTVSTTLGRLVNDGLVRTVRRGVWAAAREDVDMGASA
jgi:DNA-binding transcriptional ArsR family regulator